MKVFEKQKFVSKLCISQTMRNAPFWNSMNMAVKELFLRQKAHKDKEIERKDSSNKILEAGKKMDEWFLMGNSRKLPKSESEGLKTRKLVKIS